MSAKTPTQFQLRCMRLIFNNMYRCMDINGINLFTKSSRLAVYSAMESARKNNWVFVTRTREDQWGILLYYLTKKGEELAGAEQ